MPPTPETIGPILPTENQCDTKSTSSSTNQYTNQAFINEDDDENDKKTIDESTTGLPEKPNASITAYENMDFDDILPYIGEFGTYQKILFFLMIPFAFFVAFVYFSQIFITLVPEKHWCRVYELEHLTVEQR